MSHPFRDSLVKRTSWKAANIKTGYRRGEEERVRDKNGELIASLTENGLHAPALDMDFPVQALRNGHRTRLFLGLPGPIKAGAWRDLLAVLADSGLVGHETVSGEMGWLEETRPDEALAVVPPLVFDTPVIVHPSTTEGHHHVYVEKEVSWEGYARILRRMSATGIIETTYREFAEKRKMTMLLKPGLKNRTKLGLMKRLFSRSAETWNPPKKPFDWGGSAY